MYCDQVHACIMVIVHARPMSKVHGCIMIIVHARTLIKCRGASGAWGGLGYATGIVLS